MVLKVGTDKLFNTFKNTSFVRFIIIRLFQTGGKNCYQG